MDFWIPGFPFRFMIQSRGQIIVKWKGRGVGLGKKANPGGCKMQGSYFNPAEVWSQEDWEIEPQKLLKLALNSF